MQTYRRCIVVEQQAERDQKIKQTQSRLFEDPNATKMIHLEGFPGRKVNVMVLTAIIETAVDSMSGSINQYGFISVAMPYFFL